MARTTMPVEKPVALSFHPATPSRWPDVEKLFGDRGACAGCWCMFWRLKRKAWEASKGAGNKRLFRELIESGGRPGVLAYAGREPVGWCAVAPRADYDYLSRTRTLKPIDDQPVWSISCLFVLRPWRRKGVASALVNAAAEYAAKQGATIVEAYPTVASSDKAPDAFLWHGTPDMFTKAGFREVARPSRTRPILRRAVTKKA